MQTDLPHHRQSQWFFQLLLGVALVQTRWEQETELHGGHCLLEVVTSLTAARSTPGGKGNERRCWQDLALSLCAPEREGFSGCCVCSFPGRAGRVSRGNGPTSHLPSPSSHLPSPSSHLPPPTVGLQLLPLPQASALPVSVTHFPKAETWDTRCLSCSWLPEAQNWLWWVSGDRQGSHLR